MKRVTDVLAIPSRIVDELIAHARSELPHEACGLLSGDRNAGRATTFHPARNALSSGAAFEVHPEDLVHIVLGIERDGSHLVAIFHSHPRSAAVPSPTDLREAAYRVAHVICGRVADGAGRPELRAWSFEDGAARELTLQVG